MNKTLVYQEQHEKSPSFERRVLLICHYRQVTDTQHYILYYGKHNESLNGNVKKAGCSIFCSCSVQHTQHTRHVICTQYADPYFSNICFLHRMCFHARSYMYFGEKCCEYQYLFTVDYVMIIQVRTQNRANLVCSIDIWDRP
jgi:hypothetical protein